MKIIEMSEAERPRERLLSNGAGALSNAELIAILLGTGCTGVSAVETAQILLAQCEGSLVRLFGMSSAQLSGVKGISKGKCSSILAAAELGRRFFSEAASSKRRPLLSARSVYELMIPLFKGLKHEECWVIHLSASGYPILKQKVSSGSLDCTVIDNRAIIRKALETGTASLILTHNHPGLSPDPSRADMRQTELLRKAADSMEIKLLDHVIICDDSFYSFADETGYKA